MNHRYLFILFVFLLVKPLCGHVVQDFYAETNSDGKRLRFEIIFDASYATPEGNLPGRPQLARKWLYTLGTQQHEALRQKSAVIVRHIIRLHNQQGERIEYAVQFPDYDSPLPDFPKRTSGGAYLTVRLEAPLPDRGEICISQVDRAYPFFVIKVTGIENPYFMNLYPEEPGQNLPYLKTEEAVSDAHFPDLVASGFSVKSFFFFLKDGYRHVIPAGWDHILFILALCLLSLKWKPLLHQSLLFTLAHSITLGMSVSGWVVVFPRIIEPLIALSIAWMALENLFVNKVTRFRMVMIFVFGLIHGMGFGSVLADKIQNSGEFLMALFASNLGVELAQASVIGTMLILFGKKLQATPTYGKVRITMSIVIATAGLGAFIIRLIW